MSRIYRSTEELWAEIKAHHDVVDSEEHEGHLITYHYHDDSESPRQWDNLGVMACEHSRYDLGDDDTEWVIDAMRRAPMKVVVRWLKVFHGATVVMPLWLYDHSGITMSTSTFASDGAGWDTSLVGIIFDTPATRQECGTPLDLIAECLEGEVETYAQYLEGDVYGYIIWDECGVQGDSCWGFYGMDDVKAEARSAVPTKTPVGV